MDTRRTWRRGISKPMCFIQRDISGKQLRNQLQKIIQKRITELKTQLPFLAQPT